MNKIKIFFRIVLSHIKSFINYYILGRRISDYGQRTLDFVLKYLFTENFSSDDFTYSDTLIYNDLVNDYHECQKIGYENDFRLFLYFTALKLLELIPNNQEFNYVSNIEKDIPEP